MNATGLLGMIRNSANSGKQFLEDMKDGLIGGVTEIGISSVFSAVGTIIGGPLGGILGALMGQGIGKGINWLRNKAKMNARSMEFAMSFLTDKQEKMAQRRRDTSSRYTELQNLLKTGKDRNDLTDLQMEERIR